MCKKTKQNKYNLKGGLFSTPNTILIVVGQNLWAQNTVKDE